MQTPSSVLRAPAYPAGSQSWPETSTGDSRYTEAWAAAIKTGVSRVVEVLFGCNHDNFAFPQRNRQVCLDCGYWRPYELDGPGQEAKIGRWQKPDSLASIRHAAEVAHGAVGALFAPVEEGAGVDFPGVGRVPPIDIQEVTQALRDFLDGDGPDIPIGRLDLRTYEEVAAANAETERREALLIKLLFAAKNLAASRVIASWPRPKFPYCLECGAGGAPHIDLRHASSCRTGRVLSAIAGLEAQVLDSNSTRKETAHIEQGRAGVGDRSRGDWGQVLDGVFTCGGCGDQFCSAGSEGNQAPNLTPLCDVCAALSRASLARKAGRQ